MHLPLFNYQMCVYNSDNYLEGSPRASHQINREWVGEQEESTTVEEPTIYYITADSHCLGALPTHVQELDFEVQL